MTEIENFEQKLDAIIKEHPTLSYEDMAESFEFYAEQCRRHKA